MTEVAELKQAIEDEKALKLEKKRIEREAALKVIKENEEDRKKRIMQKEKDKITAQ
jgi:hypothetical protein